MTNSADLLGIEHQIGCPDGEICKIDIIKITDLQTPPENKVQVYISGTVHGNERVGPHAAYYLIELLVSNFDRDDYITEMLKTREIIITPMTNAPGFAYNEREERMNQAKTQNKMYSVDINRDFPYN